LTSPSFAPGKTTVVKKQTGGFGLLAKSRKVTFIQGRASLRRCADGERRDLGRQQKVEADYIIIATGSRPTTVPNVSIDSPKVLDSTTALDLPDVPAGSSSSAAGYIGLELGPCTRARVEGDRGRDDRRLAAWCGSRSRGGGGQAHGDLRRGDSGSRRRSPA
jgi:pyruvate/2-oxoglutarate dehydrogenase complex dihydrolipoamide dehydrogenase (E3) component